MANYNSNLVKINRNYTIEEAASLIGTHKNTISTWMKNGLPYLDERKPFLILGGELKEYLVKRKKKNKQQCKDDEMYCVRCKKPSQLAENFVEYIPHNQKSGRLRGFCIVCECLMNKIVTVNKLEYFSNVFDLSLSQALERINDSGYPL